jgi:hypothetical protein
MTVHIQVHSATARLWTADKTPWVDLHDWSGGVVGNPEKRGHVVILGAAGAPPEGYHREIFEAIADVAFGFDFAKWLRMKNGVARWTRPFDLTPYRSR